MSHAAQPLRMQLEAADPHAAARAHPAHDVRMVHLVRDGRGVAFSNHKTVVRTVASGESRPSSGGTARRALLGHLEDLSQAGHRLSDLGRRTLIVLTWPLLHHHAYPRR